MGKRRLSWVFIILVLSCLCFSGMAVGATSAAKVHFIDVGQADSIYIQLPNHIDVLIDGGNEADSKTVVDYLKAQKVDDIELMIATHPHEDHIGGLPAVLKAFKVEEIIDSGKDATSKIYKTYAADALAEGCPWVEDAYQTKTWGTTALKILTGNETWNDINDYSVVCRLDTGNIEFLFTGDAETPVEKILKGDISADILKIGHHGSTSSTSPNFLSKVNPRVAVICVGAGNTYGHPAASTITKLKNAGIAIYRTDLNSNVVIDTDGTTYSVTCTKGTPTSGQQSVQNNTTTAPSTEKNYVGSKSSDKYHLPSCTHAKKIAAENQVWFATKADAAAAGYTPCAVCKP